MIDPDTEFPAGSIEARIAAAIRTIFDPELPVNIYDLGLIYEINVNDAGDAHVMMTLTAPNCPVAGSLPGQVESKVRGVPGVRSAAVELTWEPKWTADRLSAAAKLELEFTGHTGPIGGPRSPMTGLTLGRREIGRRQGRRDDRD